MRTSTRRLSLAVAVAAALTVTTAGPAGAGLQSGPEPLPRPPVRVEYVTDGTGIQGQFIVTLRSGARTAAKSGGYRWLRRYDHALHGFAARLSPLELNRLRGDADVVAIEQDRILRATTTQTNPTYGLDRIDQRSLPLNKKYTYRSTGTGVNAYVIDTGIKTTHPQFGGRADVVYDGISDGMNGQDCNGHGTHVAGIIGSRTYGVAKNVRLHAVRVLDCDGTGTLSGVIDGVNWVKANKAAKAVANMSLGGRKSTALNNAVTALSRAGVFLTVAAGNDGSDACNTSPASAGYVEATGATNSKDARMSWSNYGSCVDIYAPGSNIWSTYTDDDRAMLSGTSMAAPFVTGVAALYKAARGDASFSTVQHWLHVNAGAKVRNFPSGSKSHNRLLFKSTL
ncbi:MAG TPA: S8 family peptidase [Streptosporangiaceae bacterium]|nr:S8 family peptidase [Streptosporangiaceae bacterium]